MTNVKKNKESVLVGRSLVTCARSADGKKHYVCYYADGTVTCGCGESAIESAARAGALVRLGGPEPTERTCASLACFLTSTLPGLIGRDDHATVPDANRTVPVDDWRSSEGWKSYSSLAVTQDVYGFIQSQDPRAKARSVATKEILKCKSYRDGMTRDDFAEELYFSNAEPSEGAQVAAFSSDTWSIPLATDWLESVAKKGLALFKGMFVVAVENESLLAIAGSNDEGFVIKRFSLGGAS